MAFKEKFYSLTLRWLSCHSKTSNLIKYDVIGLRCYWKPLKLPSGGRTNSISGTQILTPCLMKLICLPVGWRYLSRTISFQRIIRDGRQTFNHSPSSLLFPDLFPQREALVAEQQTSPNGRQLSTSLSWENAGRWNLTEPWTPGRGFGLATFLRPRQHRSHTISHMRQP